MLRMTHETVIVEKQAHEPGERRKNFPDTRGHTEAMIHFDLEVAT